jgi:hypothetical protein
MAFRFLVIREWGRDLKILFSMNIHRCDYSELRGSFAWDLSSCIPDGFFYGLLQFRIEEGMVEHGESSDKGDRLENCQRRFPPRIGSVPGSITSAVPSCQTATFPYPWASQIFLMIA